MALEFYELEDIKLLSGASMQREPGRCVLVPGKFI